MKYIALDIETSDLHANPNNVLTLSLVADTDPTILPEFLPCLNLLFVHPVYSSGDIAMAMNQHILVARALGSGTNDGQMIALTSSHIVTEAKKLLYNSNIAVNWTDAMVMIRKFLESVGGIKTLAGKNVGSFDMQFLPDEMKNLFNYRILDTGSMYVTKDDRRIPTQDECLRRAGLEDTVSHDAYGDNLQTVKLIRNFWK